MPDTRTATKPPPASAECTGAKQLDWPEMHKRCAGNSVVRIPAFTAPVQEYKCGCTCHAGSGRQP